ncbi:MAG: hypothetical protein ACI8PB_003206 [Desulforhopalus sp.]|jgi:hypothetical protein
MEKLKQPDRNIYWNLMAIFFSLGLVMLFGNTARADVALTVEGVNNCAPLAKPDVCTTTKAPLTGGFRWLIEEDKTYHVPLNDDGTVKTTAGVPDLDPNWRVGDPNRNTVSVSFHHSYMPVVMTGDETTLADLNTLDASKNYFISVLPDEGYSIGGAPIKAGDTAVTVYVNANPIPTAQITIFVHEDIAPINNVWDLGETGLEGFAIILEDAGGKYGISAGIQSQDAFGNLLCTSYQYTDSNGNGSHDPGELFVEEIDPDTGLPTGNPVIDVAGSGCVTGACGVPAADFPDCGMVTIRNLAPGKYGVLAVPPNAVEDPDTGFVSSIYTQTSTIEGKKLIDAWVKANEPAFFGEFGPPGPHVSIGFVPAGPDDPYIDATVLTGGATISGDIVNLHLSRPPDTIFYAGGPFPHTTPWVGLNKGAAGEGRGVYAARANGDGSFSIPNVPPGAYQLVVWDDNLDLLFAKRTVIVNADTNGNFDGTCNATTSCFLDVPVFQWFARMENYIYNDENENGVRDCVTPECNDNTVDEVGIIEQAVNLRWRDGTVYQSFATDGDGFAPFDEVFPFFSWLVAEVDFARFKATGVTLTVDDGGPIGASAEGAGTNWNQVLNPQIQGNPLDPDSVFPIIDMNSPAPTYRTEVGPVLSQGVQAFLGQTNVFEWGKKAYAPNENGGISGVVMYAVTRAEDDPEAAAAEPWEPGIPNVTVKLYDSKGTTLLATTTTDSWDDSLPTNCQYGSNADSGTDDPFVFRDVDTDCYDGMRNWNQVRPGVFDGGYAFGPEIDCGNMEINNGACRKITNDVGGKRYLKTAQYVVEVIAPTGYQIIRSQDRNVDFGDTFFPSPELLPPPCVGTPYTVPAELALFPGEAAPLAGQSLPLCDRKEVALSSGANAAADFSLFTEVPIAGHFIGFILDDTANEFDPTSPQFGEKYAPPFLPVSIRDWTGREISRTVSDEYGVYNALIPSTFTENLGQPSGISPNMLTTCMNAKSLPNGDIDPLHNPQYSQFCYTFQYMPGSTTYLDTPVVPVAAFAGPDQNPLDCEYVAGTPRIYSVNVPGNGEGGGPYLPENYLGKIQASGILITSVGTIDVPNPAYCPAINPNCVNIDNDKTITRDYGFGTRTLGDLSSVTIGGIAVAIDTWGDAIISASAVNTVIPVGAHQLVVTRTDGTSTITGVTVQVGLRNNANVIAVTPEDGNGAIQAAIDIAGTNDLILVRPGTYDEMVIMYKPVQLQGWGEGSTFIDAIKAPFNKLSEWRILAESLLIDKDVDLVPGQELGFGGIEPDTFFSEEGAGVFVLAKNQHQTSFASNKGARIDGFTISGADTGGGIVLNGYADDMDISNNRIVNNSAFFAGGIRVGHPLLTDTTGRTILYSDADNDNVSLHHNTVTQNGGLSGAGGGIALHTGSDSYQVTDNFVCGNFTTAGGAGIAHFGFSDTDGRSGPVPLIEGNTVIFNENFNQGTTVNGGGILVSGMPAFGCPVDPNTGVPDPACLIDQVQVTSRGSGSVQIIGNLIKGNSAGVGDGAGIRLSRINGQDVAVSNKGEVSVDYVVDIINNMIVDNMAALAGGGISLQDALAVNILHNTIANNDNASTSGDAFTTGVPSQSNAQPGAGIVSRQHSVELAQFLTAAVPAETFSDAYMVDNIIWHNRKFFWLLDDVPVPAVSGLCPDIFPGIGLTCAGGNAPVYDDLAVIPAAAGTLTCDDCIMTGPADPAFVAEYVNGSRNTTTVLLEGTIKATPAFDEGGNFIRLRYGPLTQTDTDNPGVLLGDYHIQTGSSAINASLLGAGVFTDFDGEPRPVGAFDIGADEVQ